LLLPAVVRLVKRLKKEQSPGRPRTEAEWRTPVDILVDDVFAETPNVEYR